MCTPEAEKNQAEANKEATANGSAEDEFYSNMSDEELGKKIFSSDEELNKWNDENNKVFEEKDKK